MAGALQHLELRAREGYARLGARLDRTRAGRFALDVARGAYTVLHHLRQEPVLERAGSLSYTTVLALVPLLGVSLSIASAVGHDALRNGVRDFAFAFLAPAVRKGSLATLETFIDHATSGGVISVSGVALLFTAVMLLRSIESAINRIWGVSEGRTIPLRIAVYLTVLVFGPVLLGGSLAVTTSLRDAISHEGMPLWPAAAAVVPFLVAVVGLSILYKVAPNAAVKKRAAFAGALVASIAFEAVKHGFAYYTAHYVRYTMIYGALAAIPLFLVWVYLTWVVVLFGARLAYAVQHAGSWGYAALPRTEGMRARLAARTLLGAAVAQASGTPAPGIHTIAQACGANEAAVAESARLLRNAGLLTEDSEGGLVPARPLDQISLAQVAAASRLGAEDPTALGQDAASRAISALFDDAEHAGMQSLARLDLRTLADPLVPEAPATFAKP